MNIVDTHCHLDDQRYDQDRDDVLQRAWDLGIEFLINVSYDTGSAQQAVQLAQKLDRVYAAVGIHPHDASSYSADTEETLRQLAQAPKVVAIGEIGLDYYYDNSPRDVQREAFRRQMELAIDLGLPVVIHNRDAHQDTIDILKEFAGRARGLLHCFSGSYETARICLDLGYYLAFGGSITFKNARKLREVVQQVPLDRMVLETDCPYLTPVPHRGKRNEPSYVSHVAEKVADIRNLDLAEVAAVTTANARKVFGIV